MLEYNFYLIGKLFFEITNCDDRRYKCTFLDGDEELFSAELGKNEWMSIDREYLSNYYVEVKIGRAHV